MENSIDDLRNPHPYLNDERFEKIEALAGKGRPGPAGPVEFLAKMGFKVVKHLGSNDLLIEFQL